MGAYEKLEEELRRAGMQAQAMGSTAHWCVQCAAERQIVVRQEFILRGDLLPSCFLFLTCGHWARAW